MADEKARNQRRRDVLNYALENNFVGGHTRYLNESSVQSIRKMIRENGGKIYYEYLQQVLPKKIASVTPEKPDQPVRPYTIVEYGTQTGALSQRLSLYQEGTPVINLQNGENGDQPMQAVTNQGLVGGAGVNADALRVDENQLNNVYKVIVGKTPSVLSVMSKASDLWRRTPELKDKKSPLFDNAGKFYVVDAPECKGHQMPLPQGAFHIFIDPHEMSEHDQKVVLANVFHSSVHLLSVYAKSPQELNKLGYLPDIYLCKPSKQERLFNDFEPIQVFYNKSHGKANPPACGVKENKKTVCDPLPSVDDSQYRMLYTFDLRKQKGYVRRMACHYKSPLRVKRMTEVKPLNIQWIINHKLRPIPFSVDQAFQFEYLAGLEIQGRQARFNAGELISRKSRRNMKGFESDDSDREDDCPEDNDDVLSSDDDVNENKKELSDQEDNFEDDDEDDEDDIVKPTTTMTLRTTLAEALNDIKNQKAKPSKACQKREGNLYLRTLPKKSSKKL